jgi:WD40 repeat protein
MDPTGKVQRTWKAHAGRINRLVFSRHGTHLAAASADGTATVWIRDSGKLEHTLTRLNGEVSGISFDDADRMAVVSLNGDLRTWDSALDRERAEENTGCAGFSDVVFTGAHTVAAGCRESVLIWDVDAHKLAATLQGHSGAITAFSYVGTQRRVLASASLDRHVRVYYLDPKVAYQRARDLLKIWKQGTGQDSRP